MQVYVFLFVSKNVKIVNIYNGFFVGRGGGMKDSFEEILKFIPLDKFI